MIGRQIFILVCHDRRVDLGLSVHLTREGADSALERFKGYYDDIDPSAWREENWGAPRWCRYVHAHAEGPTAYIVVNEMRP